MENALLVDLPREVSVFSQAKGAAASAARLSGLFVTFEVVLDDSVIAFRWNDEKFHDFRELRQLYAPLFCVGVLHDSNEQGNITVKGKMHLVCVRSWLGIA